MCRISRSLSCIIVSAALICSASLADAGTAANVYVAVNGDDAAPGGEDWDSWRAVSNGNFDAHSKRADPLFVAPEAKDFRLKPDPPAFDLGFQKIDTDAIGLLPDHPFFRKSKSGA